MTSLARHRWGAKAFQAALKIAGAINAIPQKLTPPPFRLMQMGMAFWHSRALYVAARLGVADALGDQARAVDVLADELGAHPDGLYRLLRLLAGLGVFAEAAPGIFRNSKASQHLRADHPHSVRAMILMHNSPQMTRPWTEALEDGVRTGTVPFECMHGTDLFGYMDGHADFDALFSAAMDSVDAVVGDAFVHDLDWGRFARIIDVGGSKGAKTLSILKAHPDLEAVVFDRPQVVATAWSHWHGHVDESVLARVRFEGGDMLEAVPEARSDRDVYVFFAIFHGFSDAAARRALRAVKAAAGDKAPTVVIADLVLPAQDVDPMMAAMDVQMLVNTHGRERTFDQWRRLVEGEGMRICEVVDTRSPVKFVVARLEA